MKHAVRGAVVSEGFVEDVEYVTRGRKVDGHRQVRSVEVCRHARKVRSVKGEVHRFQRSLHFLLEELNVFQMRQEGYCRKWH